MSRVYSTRRDRRWPTWTWFLSRSEELLGGLRRRAGASRSRSVQLLQPGQFLGRRCLWPLQTAWAQVRRTSPQLAWNEHLFAALFLIGTHAQADLLTIAGATSAASPGALELPQMDGRNVAALFPDGAVCAGVRHALEPAVRRHLHVHAADQALLHRQQPGVDSRRAGPPVELHIPLQRTRRRRCT